MAEEWGRRREDSLADRLGLDADLATDRLGRFTPAELDDDLGCSWWQSGSPIQVLVGVDRSGRVCVAIPTTKWSGQTPVLMRYRRPRGGGRRQRLGGQAGRRGRALRPAAARVVSLLPHLPNHHSSGASHRLSVTSATVVLRLLGVVF